jgi:alpha-tubulin suppressor-like RCC1 family protein
VAFAVVGCNEWAGNNVVDDGGDPAVDAAGNHPRDLSVVDGAGGDGPPADVDGSVGPPNTDGGDLPIGITQSGCHGCAWRGNQIYCWGKNQYGELGDGTRTDHFSPAPVKGLDAVGTIAQVSAGCGNPTVNGHTCALNTYGDLWCWGSDRTGELGDQTNTDQLVPEKIVGLPPLASISLGTAHTCALTLDGHVLCWGSNEGYQVGDGTGVDRPAPTQVLDISDAVQLSAGGFHNCVRHAGGGISCWGSNNFGEVGTGDTSGRDVPTDVAGIDDAEEVACGLFHSCVRRASGGVWCFGAGQYGTIGNGMTPVTQLTPAKVILPFEPVELSAVLATCARDALGNVSCWGTTIDQTDTLVVNSTPVPVSVTDARMLSGYCAVRSTGAISCWGFNYDGEIGDGTSVDRPSPVDVPGLIWQ